MARKPLTNEEVLALLAAAPTRVAALAEGLDAQQLRAVPGGGGWSANDVLAHLRACADVWGKCIVEIITRDEPTIKAVNPRMWILGTDYPRQDFFASLDAFARQRAELLPVLQPLSLAGWQRKATVVGAGAPLVRTVYSYAAWMAEHERPHVKQIRRITEELHG